MVQSNGSFIAPVMNMSRQSQSSIALQPRLSRPLAPIPPSTPPSPVVTLISSSPASNEYSPQKHQIIQQPRRQNHFQIDSDVFLLYYFLNTYFSKVRIKLKI